MTDRSLLAQTTDAMSEAVENAAVILYGVSLAYKESANCRLEANCASERWLQPLRFLNRVGFRADGVQQKIDMIPCMMQEGCARLTPAPFATTAYLTRATRQTRRRAG